MAFFQRLAAMEPLPYFILTRGILLSCALLTSALVMLVWAGEYRLETHWLFAFADHTQTMAAIVLGAGLIGSALLEDVLVHTAK